MVTEGRKHIASLCLQFRCRANLFRAQLFYILMCTLLHQSSNRLLTLAGLALAELVKSEPLHSFGGLEARQYAASDLVRPS